MALAQPHRSEADPEDTEARRRSERRESDAAVRLFVDAAEIAGRAENLSEHGVFLFTAEGLRVQLVLEEGGAIRRCAGRIVRVQRMSEAELGLAIEFDR